jgi:hypothetical protein
MLDEETKKWERSTYKICHAILLIERVSVMCTSVYKDEDIAKRDCKELQKAYPQNRYAVVTIPTGKLED